MLESDSNKPPPNKPGMPLSEKITVGLSGVAVILILAFVPIEKIFWGEVIACLSAFPLVYQFIIRPAIKQQQQTRKKLK